MLNPPETFTSKKTGILALLSYNLPLQQRNAIASSASLSAWGSLVKGRVCGRLGQHVSSGKLIRVTGCDNAM